MPSSDSEELLEVSFGTIFGNIKGLMLIARGIPSPESELDEDDEDDCCLFRWMMEPDELLGVSFSTGFKWSKGVTATGRDVSSSESELDEDDPELSFPQGRRELPEGSRGPVLSSTGPF